MKISSAFFAALVCAVAPVVLAGDVPSPQSIRRTLGTPSPTVAPVVSGSVTCFSGETTVDVLGKGKVAMKDVHVGDSIRTAGDNKYEQVYAFGHKDAESVALFYQFHTGETRPLEMTGGHLVFLEGKTNPIRADAVKVGDVLRGESGAAKVQKIKYANKQGLYTLFTESGTLVADGIVASSYVSLQENADEYVELKGGIPTFMSYHDYVHMGLSPFRVFCMGVSSSLCNTYTEEGIPLYPSFAIDVNGWAHKQNIIVETLTLLAVMILCGACMVLENTFGASMTPLAVVAAGGAFAFYKKGPFGVRAKKVKTV